MEMGYSYVPHRTFMNPEGGQDANTGECCRNVNDDGKWASSCHGTKQQGVCHPSTPYPIPSSELCCPNQKKILKWHYCVVFQIKDTTNIYTVGFNGLHAAVTSVLLTITAVSVLVRTQVATPAHSCWLQPPLPWAYISPAWFQTSSRPPVPSVLSLLPVSYQRLLHFPNPQRFFPSICLLSSQEGSLLSLTGLATEGVAFPLKCLLQLIW